jgi:hypothetical protein
MDVGKLAVGYCFFVYAALNLPVILAGYAAKLGRFGEADPLPRRCFVAPVRIAR